MRVMLRAMTMAGVAIAVVAVAFTAGRVARHFVAPPAMAWADEAQAPQLEATAEKVAEGGADRGQVSINGAPVFTLQVESGGLSAYERAMIAANRLNKAFVAGSKPDDFGGQVIQGTECVVAGNDLIVTVDDGDAAPLGKDKAQVAEDWAAAIRTKMRDVLGEPQPGAETPAPAEAPPATGEQPQPAAAGGGGDILPPEEQGQKIVPIISVGQGLQIGAAMVKGPKRLTERVQAVAELEGKFKDFVQLEIYVPISTRTPGKSLDRVQGVGVYAVAAYKATGH
jgi:hypothetical protein